MTPDKMIPALENAVDNLLTRRRIAWKHVVMGVGIGSRDGKHREEHSLLRIYLAHPEIPGPLLDYLNDLGVPYAFQVTGKFEPLLGPGNAIESFGPYGASGTLGAIVEDINPASSPAPRYLLSCEHVLGATNNLVYQTDSAVPREIAKVSNLISLASSGLSVDAAIAMIEPGVQYRSSFPIPLAGTEPVEPLMGAHVSHWGAATSRCGMIHDIHVSLMANINSATPTLTNVALIDGEFAQPGDSGSVVIDTDRKRATAMVFARATFQGVATVVAACSLPATLKQLKVRLVAPTIQTLLDLDGVAGVSEDDGRLRILLTDDSEATRREVGYALDLLGFQGAVDYAVTGEFHLL